MKPYLEMSKTYKIHKYFDLDTITTEDPCRCSAPNTGYNIFSNISQVPQKKLLILEEYNATRGGSVMSANDIDWNNLKRSECEA